MCGKDRVELELAEQLVGTLDTQLIHQLVIGNGKLVGRIDLGIGRRTGLALAQLRHTVVLLRQVCQMEKARKGANDDLLLIERQAVDQSTTSRNATAVGSSAVGTPCSSTASSAAQVPGLPALTTISAVKILSNRSAISDHTR